MKIQKSLVALSSLAVVSVAQADLLTVNVLYESQTSDAFVSAEIVATNDPLAEGGKFSTGPALYYTSNIDPWGTTLEWGLDYTWTIVDSDVVVSGAEFGNGTFDVLAAQVVGNDNYIFFESPFENRVDDPLFGGIHILTSEGGPDASYSAHAETILTNKGTGFCYDGGILCLENPPPPEYDLLSMTSFTVDYQVPVPAAMWFFGTALLSLVGVKRYRQ